MIEYYLAKRGKTMKVYRIANRIEIDNFLENKSFKGIGSTFNENCKNNSHHYKKNTFYMHFFDSKENIFYFNSPLKRFLCTYDIPDEVIKEYLGLGKYISKYDPSKEDYVLEYAIPSKLIKLEYLETIEVLPINYTFKEFLQSGEYNSQIVYSKKNTNLLKR